MEDIHLCQKMDEKTWIGLGSIALGGLGKFSLEWYKNKIKEREDDDDPLIEFGRLHNALRLFANTNQVDRVLLLKITRSKRKKRRLSVVIEFTQIDSVYHLYQNFSPDDQYFSNVERAIKEISYIINVEDITSPTLLDVYNEEGIRFINIFYIHKTRNYIYYGSCVSKDVDLTNYIFRSNFFSLLDMLVEKFKKYAK